MQISHLVHAFAWLRLRTIGFSTLLFDQSISASSWSPPAYLEQHPIPPAAPSFHITITPVPSPSPDSNTAAYLDVKYSLEHRGLRSGDTILTIPLVIGNVPTHVDSLEFSDGEGGLPVVTQKSESQNEMSWVAMRDCQGVLTVRFSSYPRNVTEDTPSGARLDLRSQQGGLMGAGASFLPLPPRRLEVYDIFVECVTERTGLHATCVSSLGPANTRVTQPISVLANSVFSAGAMNIFSPDRNGGGANTQADSLFRCAWFEDPTFDAKEVCRRGKAIHSKLATLFGEPKHQYTLFFRRGIAHHGSGGTAFTESSIVEYDATEHTTVAEVFPIMAHEMVHNWPLMTECSASNVLDNVLWFTEGVATYYSMFLLFRWGYQSQEELLDQLNMLSVAYFTSPHIDWPNEKAQEHFWQDYFAQELPYHRGFIYFLRLNAQILHHSHGTRTLDDAVGEFASLRAENLRHDSARWVELLGTGFQSVEEAKTEYEEMINGGIVKPYGQGDLNLGFKMKRTTCERFDLGFDISSLSTRVIVGLVGSSRAAQSGLRNGDLLLVVDGLSSALRDTAKKLRLGVTRDEVTLDITFRPRSYDGVECYLWTA